MKRYRSHRLAVLTAAILLTTFASACAGDRTRIDETFDAGAAELNGVAGRVHVRLHDGRGIRLRAEGSKRWIGDLVRRTDQGVLVVTAGTLTGSSVNIAVGPGAWAETRIGSLSIISGNTVAEELPEVELFVPAGTPLTVTSAVGEWDIAALKAPLALEVAGADISTGAVTDARLAVRGSGDITVARVEGDLQASIGGSGDITVLAGSVDTLKVGITGAGSVRVHAPAERADLAVSGIGSIEVEKVRQEPKVRISGLGTVRTGYRP